MTVYFLVMNSKRCVAHCRHLKSTNHNEWLIISISFVISVVIMDNFLNTDTIKYRVKWNVALGFHSRVAA